MSDSDFLFLYKITDKMYLATSQVLFVLLPASDTKTESLTAFATKKNKKKQLKQATFLGRFSYK